MLRSENLVLNKLNSFWVQNGENEFEPLERQFVYCAIILSLSFSQKIIEYPVLFFYPFG